MNAQMLLSLLIKADADAALRALSATDRATQQLRSQAQGASGETRGLGQAGDAAARGIMAAASANQKLATSAGDAAAGLATEARAIAESSGLLRGKTAALIGLNGAAALAGSAVGTLTAAVLIGIRTFTDYERQLLTVEQVIRATGGAAGRTVNNIDRMALSIARGTLASAREVRAAAGQLLTFRSIAGETFDRTLRVAQDLAAVGFGSIEQAAMQLAKALEDPEQGLAALRRVGVSFSAAQIEMIRNFNETGRVAEAQAAILAQVEAQVGGAGAAAGGGLAGAFDTLTGEMGRFFELLGREAAQLVWLNEIMRFIGTGAARWNDALGVDDDTRELERLVAARDRLIDQMNAGLADDNPLTMSPARLADSPASAGFWTGRDAAILQVIDPATGGVLTRPYAAAGHLIAIDPVLHATGLDIHPVELRLSPLSTEVDQALRAYALRGAAVEIHRLWLDYDSRAPLAPAHVWLTGRINRIIWPLPEPGGSGALRVTVVPATRDLTLGNPETISDPVQSRRDGDRLLRYVGVAGTIEVPWMRQAVKASSIAAPAPDRADTGGLR